MCEKSFSDNSFLCKNLYIYLIYLERILEDKNLSIYVSLDLKIDKCKKHQSKIFIILL